MDLKICLWRKDRAHRDLQIGCTSNLNPIVATLRIIQLKRFSIHFYTFSIIQVYIFNFSQNPFNRLEKDLWRTD